MPATWIVIRLEDLADYLLGPQLDALNSMALGSGQTEAFTAVMHDRAAYVINRISRRLTISATPYAIPPELKTQVCLLIIEAMQTRLTLELTNDQKTVIARAYKDLDIAGTAEFPISDPADPVASAAFPISGHAKIIRPAAGSLSRDSLRGM